MSVRRLVAWIASPALAVLLLWFSLRGVDLDELARLVRGARPALLLLNVMAAPLHLLLRGFRWRTLLFEVRPDIPLRESLSATAIGYLAGVLPARVGELLRPTLLSRRVGIPFAPTLASAGIERVLLDLMVVLMLGAAGLWLPASLTGLDSQAAPSWVREFRTIGGFVLVGMLGGLVALHEVARRRGPVRAALLRRADHSRIRAWGAGLRWLADLLPGLAMLAHWRSLGLILAQTVAIWVVTAAGMHAGLSACGLSLPPGAMLIILPVVVAGISIPTPGNFGTFHVAMKLALVSIYGVEEFRAVGVAVVVHLCNWLPLMVLGGISLALGGGIPSEGSAVADTKGAQ